MSNKVEEFWKLGETRCVNTWVDVPNQLRQTSEGYCFIALRDIPIDRDQMYSIAALSPRMEQRYYLVDKNPLKNIAFYSEDEMISCESEYARKLVRFFNNKIQIQNHEPSSLHLVLNNVANEEIFLDQYFQKLSLEEFVPPSSAGIMTVVCHTDDMETRKWLYQMHDESTKEVANMERSLIKACAPLDFDLLAIHVKKDSKGHYHGNATLEQKSTLRFEQYSQSTTYNFAQNFINKIEHSVFNI